MKNKSLNLLYSLLIALFCFSACGKGGSDDNTPPPAAAEENLVVSIDPDAGGTIAKALGASYDFKVVVSSKMPAQGVDVSVTYKKDADGAVVFSQNLQTTFSPLNVTINNIPFNEVGTVTVVVTSKSKAANTVTKTFKLVRK